MKNKTVSGEFDCNILHLKRKYQKINNFLITLKIISFV